jgi:hypothetical protein
MLTCLKKKRIANEGRRLRTSLRTATAAVLLSSLAVQCRDFGGDAVPWRARGGEGDGTGAAGINGVSGAGAGDGPREAASGRAAGGAGAAEQNLGGHTTSDGGTAGRGGQKGNDAGASEGTSGRRGVAGTSGVADPEDGGAAGASRGLGGASPNGLPAPGVFGAVRILVNGVPVCGGTLITNSWVLTAKHCVAETQPASISVGFGADAKDFQQTRGVLELDAYPDDVGPHPARDLALLGVDTPFEIDGSTTRHFIPLVPWASNFLGGYTCVGWDLAPDPDSPTNRLRTVALTPLTWLTQDDGGALWWSNTEPFDVEAGILLTPNDAGSGCFYRYGNTTYLASVHTSNPADSLSGGPNHEQQAYSLTLGEEGIQNWIERTLFGVVPPESLDIQGVGAVCSSQANAADFFARRTEGAMGWYHRSAPVGEWQTAAWVEQPPLDAPLGAALGPERPGTLCHSDGSIELVARATDGTLWWQHFAPSSGWASAWSRVNDSTWPVVSGVALVGLVPDAFDVYGRGESADLLHAHHAAGTDTTWESLGGTFSGAPAACQLNEYWFNVVVRGATDQLADLFAWGTPPTWGWLYDSGGAPVPASAEPAVTCSRDSRLDIFGRNARRLTRLSYDEIWSPWLLDVGVNLPDGDLTAVTREPGNWDVFASGPGLPLWHGVWPRRPLGPAH